MRQIVFSSQYNRDLKLALRRNLPEEKLNFWPPTNRCQPPTKTMR